MSAVSSYGWPSTLKGSRRLDPSAYTPYRPKRWGRSPGEGKGLTGGSEMEPLEAVPEGLNQDSADQPLTDSEELRGLILLGRERGYLTFEQIAATLEEVEVTKEQVSALHAHLVE